MSTGINHLSFCLSLYTSSNVGSLEGPITIARGLLNLVPWSLSISWGVTNLTFSRGAFSSLATLSSGSRIKSPTSIWEAVVSHISTSSVGVVNLRVRGILTSLRHRSPLRYTTEHQMKTTYLIIGVILPEITPLPSAELASGRQPC